MQETTAPKSDLAYWAPWRLDPVLLQEREGHWRWYWALLFTALSVALFVLLYIAGNWAIATFARGSNTMDGYSAAQDTLSSSLFIPGQPYTYIMIFVLYLALIAAVVISLSIRAQTFRAGFNLNSAGGFREFWKAGGALAAILALTSALQFALFPGSYALRDVSASHFVWVGLAAFVLLAQTLGEELFFRGFLLRLWGAVVPVRLLIVGLVSAFFISVHVGNPDVQVDLYFSLVVFVALECLYYWVLFRTRSVYATWGMHWVNNVFAILVIAQAPGWKNDISIITFTDPVLTAGGSYAANPVAYVGTIAVMLIFIGLTAWKRSPFYLAPAPVENPNAPELVAKAEAPTDDWPPWFPRPAAGDPARSPNP